MGHAHIRDKSGAQFHVVVTTLLCAIMLLDKSRLIHWATWKKSSPVSIHLKESITWLSLGHEAHLIGKKQTCVRQIWMPRVMPRGVTFRPAKIPGIFENGTSTAALWLVGGNYLCRWLSRRLVSEKIEIALLNKLDKLQFLWKFIVIDEIFSF